MNNFREHCLSKSNPVNVDELLERAMKEGEYSPLEDALMEYFSELTIKSPGGNNVAPSRNSVHAFKSHIKRWILLHTDGKVDIGSPFTFRVRG